MTCYVPVIKDNLRRLKHPKKYFTIASIHGRFSIFNNASGLIELSAKVEQLMFLMCSRSSHPQASLASI